MDSVAKQSGYPKEVFFLGAGASVLAGVPTFSNFFETACEVSSEYEKEKNLEITKLFMNVLGYWNDKFHEYNIEQFYEAIEMNEILRNKKEIIDTRDIEKFIYFTIKKSLNDEYHGIYKTFLNIVGTKGATVITTNWDIVLESAMSYLLEDGWINYENVFEHNASNIVSDIPKEDLTDDDIFRLLIKQNQYFILKLHGSLNWGFCENCGKIYYFNKKIYDDLNSRNGEKCNSAKCKNKNIKLKTIIVPPTLSKLVRPNQEIESNSLKLPYFQLVPIWKKAYNCLKSCKNLYFIGYSFPETDVQMKIFISNALRDNSNLEEVIIVSNPKHGNSRVAFEERYLSILQRFGHDKIKFCYKSFKEFCKSMPHRVIFD